VGNGDLMEQMYGGTRRERRRMRRLERQFDRAAGRTASRPRGRRRFRVGRVLVTGLVLGLVVAAGIRDSRASLSALWTPRREVVDPGSSSSYKFVQHQTALPSEAVTYDPCHSIDVVVNDDLAPLGADRMLLRAMAAVSKASGFRLHLVGHTHKLPLPGAESAALSPVLVAWTTPQVVPRLAGRTVGLGGSLRMVTDPGVRAYYATGTVSLDAPALTKMLAEPRGEQLVVAVMMHEFGHVLGLAHVDDPHQLMNKENLGLTAFGAGDLAGLALLGSAPCQ